MNPKSSKKLIDIYKYICSLFTNRYTQFFMDKQDLYGHIDHRRAEHLLSQAVEEKYRRDCAKQLPHQRASSQSKLSSQRKIKLDIINNKPKRYALYFTRSMQSAYNPAWGGCVAWNTNSNTITLEFCDCLQAGEFIDVSRIELYTSGGPRMVHIPARVIDVYGQPSTTSFIWEQKDNKFILMEEILWHLEK